MITQPLEEGANEVVVRALELVLGPSRGLDQLAENLIAITAQHGLRIEEELLNWIGYSVPGKEWSCAEYRRWCERYIDLVRELAERQAEYPPQKICEVCFAHVAQRSGSRWWCDECGLV